MWNAALDQSRLQFPCRIELNSNRRATAIRVPQRRAFARGFSYLRVGRTCVTLKVLGVEVWHSSMPRLDVSGAWAI